MLLPVKPAPRARLEAAANAALPLWDLPPGARARLINISENAVFLVTLRSGWKAVLRLHRAAYQTCNAIASELAWMSALRDANIAMVPAALPGKNGKPVQTARFGDASRYFVMFEFVDGAHPDENVDQTDMFYKLGILAARLHRHAAAWQRPSGFARFSWDADALLGPKARWGDWRCGPHLSAQARAVLTRAEAAVRRNLSQFGKTAQNYGLVHADMRLANLIVRDGQITLIDFDDCGSGWHLYDFAAAVSFLEDRAELAEWRAAWICGYAQVAPLGADELAMIDTFVMARRLTLLGWIGSHGQAGTARQLAPDFAAISAELAASWLAGHQ